ncbi:DUF952 domain-containing protein [Ferruginibacter lapsinanis]|uniref:DUF952 domain-containing protein n=1 Tax=Ferruginibacter lapsinanis TaxID=563172 RepID=UPI001E39E2DB|nr:DUF952 domain-containing protein [Ferruginibacter lapsinanis]UEG49283.1 DUF952 domain-containing protein [Ferruginibacter lapsinanis]
MIYHVVTSENWQKALAAGFYEAPSLHTEGFIHTSKKEQLAGVLERYYKGATNLLLLHIDENKLTALLKYELAPSVNELFPHIYGRLNMDAVIEVTEI